ncbi:TPA: hypothetical protein ACGIK9_003350 [Acinetobacter baumannii]|uniref:hypothetical protein n=1 Tax=Acinetobacter baumannii TaxID=470 RepID=UPI00338EF1C2
MNRTIFQDEMDEISLNAAQLASFLVVLITIVLIGSSAYLNKGNLTSALKNLFPENLFIFGLVLTISFGIISISIILKSKSKVVTFKKEFMFHFSLLSGVAITLFGLVSRLLF